MLAAGADDEIGLGQRAGEQARGEEFRRDGLGIQAAFLGGARQFARGVGDLFLAAIVEGEGEIEALVGDGAVLGVSSIMRSMSLATRLRLPMMRTRTPRATSSSRSLRK